MIKRSDFKRTVIEDYVPPKKQKQQKRQKQQKHPNHDALTNLANDASPSNFTQAEEIVTTNMYIIHTKHFFDELMGTPMSVPRVLRDMAQNQLRGNPALTVLDIAAFSIGVNYGTTYTDCAWRIQITTSIDPAMGAQFTKIIELINDSKSNFQPVIMIVRYTGAGRYLLSVCRSMKGSFYDVSYDTASTTMSDTIDLKFEQYMPFTPVENIPSQKPGG